MDFQKSCFSRNAAQEKKLLSHCGEFIDRREEMDAMSFVRNRQQRAAVKSKDVIGPSDVCTFNPSHCIHSSWLSSRCDSRLQKKIQNKCVTRLIVGPFFYVLLLMTVRVPPSVRPSVFLSMTSSAISLCLFSLSLAPLSLELHLRGTLLSSLEHTRFPIKSRCICLSSLFLPSE